MATIPTSSTPTIGAAGTVGSSATSQPSMAAGVVHLPPPTAAATSSGASTTNNATTIPGTMPLPSPSGLTFQQQQQQQPNRSPAATSTGVPLYPTLSQVLHDSRAQGIVGSSRPPPTVGAAAMLGPRNAISAPNYLLNAQQVLAQQQQQQQQPQQAGVGAAAASSWPSHATQQPQALPQQSIVSPQRTQQQHQQLPQQASVSAPASSLSSSSSSSSSSSTTTGTSTNAAHSDSNTAMVQASAAEPGIGVKRPLPPQADGAASDAKRRMIEAMNMQYRERACHPDYRTPFSSKKEVWERLLPYQVFRTADDIAKPEDSTADSAASRDEQLYKRAAAMRQRVVQKLHANLDPLIISSSEMSMMRKQVISEERTIAEKIKQKLAAADAMVAARLAAQQQQTTATTSQARPASATPTSLPTGAVSNVVTATPLVSLAANPVSFQQAPAAAHVSAAPGFAGIVTLPNPLATESTAAAGATATTLPGTSVVAATSTASTPNQEPSHANTTVLV